MKKIITYLSICILTLNSCDLYKIKILSVNENNKLVQQKKTSEDTVLLNKFIESKKLNAQYIIKTPNNFEITLKKTEELFKIVLKKRHPLKCFFRPNIKYELDSISDKSKEEAKYSLMYKGFTFYRPLPNGRKMVFFYSEKEKVFIYYEGGFGSKF